MQEEATTCSTCGLSFHALRCISFLDGGVHLGGCISTYGEMNIPDDDGEDVKTTSLLIEGEGKLSIEPFQLNDQST